MTFRDANENSDKMTGQFGSNQARRIRASKTRRQKHNKVLKTIQSPILRNISAERWVDIICIPLILLFLISVFANWESFLNSFFSAILFPIISTGAILLVLLVIIGIVIGFIHAKLRCRRR